jgi:hypothetical protein
VVHATLEASAHSQSRMEVCSINLSDQRRSQRRQHCKRFHNQISSLAMIHETLFAEIFKWCAKKIFLHQQCGTWKFLCMQYFFRFINFAKIFFLRASPHAETSC